MASQPEPVEALTRRVEQLSRDLTDAVEQQAAVSQVLAVIGRSASDLEPVFETVLSSAIRLCRADAGGIWQLDGDVFRLVSASGGSDAHRRLLAENPLRRDRGSLVGRVALERSTVQIADARSDPRYEWQAARETGGFRTIAGVPMLTEGEVVGVIALWRTRVDEFSDRQIDVVNTFAAHGAIAIKNGNLFQESRRRSGELARLVGELRALGEVAQAVSSSLDLHQVLSTILAYAVRLSETEGGSIFEFDEERREFHVRTAYGTGDELLAKLRRTRVGLDDTLMGRAATSGRAEQVPDIAAAPSDAHLAQLLAAGWRSTLIVPLLREDEIMGALAIRRRTTGAFPERTVTLLETLASQSAVAISNARVFRELEQKTLELEVASRHKSEFLASMSHELRTPLNAVIGFSDVLLERMFGDLNDRQEEYLRDIRDSGRHLLELLNEILDLSKVEAGRMELDLAPMSLPDVLEHCVTMVRERAAAHGLRLGLVVADDLGTICADELRIKQVVLNLLTNAIKFTPAGGSVEAEARLVGDEAQISVRDTGIGIPEHEHARIFEAFQQGGRNPRASAEGTGLGLTLSRRIIELHGGRIWMTSRPGEGSTFSIAVPARLPDDKPADADAGADAAEAAEPVGNDGATTTTVLVIEDDRHSLDLVTVYLRSAGYGVVAAPDGERGLELVRELRPEAVILDVLLPGVDGWEVLARLKSDPSTAALPVIVTSMLDERGHGFALGASEYLVKPVRGADIVDALRRSGATPDPPRSVVVIDDDPASIARVTAILEPQGWAVIARERGEDCVDLVRAERPAVVLLDLLVRDVDGFDLVERLAADSGTRDVPIVVLTSRSMSEEERRRLDGQIGYLAAKGDFDARRLGELVQRVASRRRPEEAAWPAS